MSKKPLTEGKVDKMGVNEGPTTGKPDITVPGQSVSESDNALKLEALKAAVSSGFLSGFTSAANKLTLQLLRRKLSPEEFKEYSKNAIEGADTWYVPTFLATAGGQAIAELLGIELPEVEEIKVEEKSNLVDVTGKKIHKPTPPPLRYLREDGKK